jgi:hypothetical protein
MVLPDGSEFVAHGELSVTEVQQPAWLFDGFNETAASYDEIQEHDGQLTEHVYDGAGSAQRQWRCNFSQWTGNSSAWTGANASDDAVTKLQTLSHEIASQRIASSNSATLEFGELSSGGKYDPQAVVPGEVEIETDLADGTPSLARARITWLDALDTDGTLHKLNPFNYF